MKKVVLITLAIAVLLMMAGPVMADPPEWQKRSQTGPSNNYTRPGSDSWTSSKVGFPLTNPNGHKNPNGTNFLMGNNYKLAANEWVHSSSLGTLRKDIHIHLDTHSTSRFTISWYPYFDILRSIPSIEEVDRYKCKWIEPIKPKPVDPPEGEEGYWREIGKVN